ncbi:MAG: hypothetical protein ACERKZ_20635 [Lachnotalea sp.]
MSNIDVLVKDIIDVITQKKQLEEKEKDLRLQIIQVMESQKIKTLENVVVKISYVEQFNKKLIDRDKLRKLYPDAEKQCMKEVPIEAYVKVKVM